MAFNFELKMLIAPLGIAGSLKLQKERDPLPAIGCGSKQSLLDARSDAQLEAPGITLGASLRQAAQEPGSMDTGIPPNEHL